MLLFYAQAEKAKVNQNSVSGSFSPPANANAVSQVARTASAAEKEVLAARTKPVGSGAYRVSSGFAPTLAMEKAVDRKLYQ